MLFERGDRVEITNNEEGMAGSYFTANIIASLSNKDYIIQYKTLLKEDSSGPLREVVSTDHIRPVPNEIVVSKYSVLDTVDAYDNDGWWVGKIIENMGSKYLVHFENNEKVAYPSDRLRVHQEWVNGAWTYSKK